MIKMVLEFDPMAGTFQFNSSAPDKVTMLGMLAMAQGMILAPPKEGSLVVPVNGAPPPLRRLPKDA